MAETLLSVAGEMRAVHRTIAQALEFIEKDAPDLRRSIVTAKHSGGTVTLFCRDSSGVYLLERWLRSNRVRLTSACMDPPRAVRVRAGGAC